MIVAVFCANEQCGHWTHFKLKTRPNDVELRGGGGGEWKWITSSQPESSYHQHIYYYSHSTTFDLFQWFSSSTTAPTGTGKLILHHIAELLLHPSKLIISITTTQTRPIQPHKA